MTHSTSSHCCSALKLSLWILHTYSVLAARSSVPAAFASSPSSFLVPSSPPSRLTCSCVLLHEPWIFYRLNSYQTDSTSGQTVIDEHGSNMQWQEQE